MSYTAWDDFHRSDRALHLDTLPTGQQYRYQGKAGTMVLMPVIRDNEFVPDPAVALVSPYGSAILCPLPSRPELVSADFRMTEGSTVRQNVVIGACTTYLAEGSVQLAVWPNSAGVGCSWRLFTVRRVPPVGGTLIYRTLTEGTTADLAYDERYRVGISFDADASAVTIQPPTGEVVTFVDAELTALWGVRAFAQIRSEAPTTDGKIQVLMFSAHSSE